MDTRRPITGHETDNQPDKHKSSLRRWLAGAAGALSLAGVVGLSINLAQTGPEDRFENVSHIEQYDYSATLRPGETLTSLARQLAPEGASSADINNAITVLREQFPNPREMQPYTDLLKLNEVLGIYGEFNPDAADRVYVLSSEGESPGQVQPD